MSGWFYNCPSNFLWEQVSIVKGKKKEKTINFIHSIYFNTLIHAYISINLHIYIYIFIYIYIYIYIYIRMKEILFCQMYFAYLSLKWIIWYSMKRKVLGAYPCETVIITGNGFNYPWPKSWMRLFVFNIVLINLEKRWIQLFSLLLWVNSMANYAL